jgi:branched-chain amino acid transport system ATP-binding protein
VTARRPLLRDLPSGQEPGGATGSLLQVRGVRKAFGGVVANADISIDVPEGAIIGLIGPNGSGKTTLFNSIVGFHRIDCGSVRFDGHEVAGMSVAQTARRGLVRTFQQSHVFDRMSCLDNVRISDSHARETPVDMLRSLPCESDERALQLLDFAGLHEERHANAGELSYGQRKLLELAMALMSGPKLLLLDEPTAGVNPTMINGVVARLLRANDEMGITLLVIEHNMRVIMSLARKIYCLAQGRVLAAGAPDEVRSDPRVIEAYLGSR